LALAKTLNASCQSALRADTSPDREGISTAMAALSDMLEALGLSMADMPESIGQDEAMVESLMTILLELRRSARENKDWAMADSIRKSLQAAGILVEDSPQGARWKRA